MRKLTRAVGTVFTAVAFCAITMPGAQALTTDGTAQVPTAPIAAVGANPTAPVGEPGGGWHDDCDHYGCDRGPHDVRCEYSYHRRVCEGWDGDRPWRSYDEWWHEGPDHEWQGWSDGPERYRRDGDDFRRTGPIGRP